MEIVLEDCGAESAASVDTAQRSATRVAMLRTDTARTIIEFRPGDIVCSLVSRSLRCVFFEPEVNVPRLDGTPIRSALPRVPARSPGVAVRHMRPAGQSRGGTAMFRQNRKGVKR